MALVAALQFALSPELTTTLPSEQTLPVPPITFSATARALANPPGGGGQGSSNNSIVEQSIVTWGVDFRDTLKM